MALKGASGDESHKTYANLFCSEELTGGLQNHLISISALNIVLSITAVLGNTLILAALHKESSLHPPSKVLFRSLAVTDLCVGFIVDPLAVMYWITVVNEQWYICRLTRKIRLTTSYVLCSVSLFTLTAISVDRLLALLLGLRYRQVVTVKRTLAVIVVFCFVSIVGTALSFWNYLLFRSYLCLAVSLCLVTSISSYTKIFSRLRHHQVQNSLPEQPRQTIPFNVARFKKVVFSVLWVQLALVLCYLPYTALVLSTSRAEPSSGIFIARQATVTLVYLNSSINPFLYCWKIREVRQAVKETIRHIFCLSD